MAYVRTAVTSMVVALLAACASAPKPVMPDAEYKRLATQWVVVHRCAQTGHLTPDTAAYGRRFVEAGVNYYTFEVQRMEQYVKAYEAATPPTPELCNIAAMAIMAEKQRIDQHNTAVAADQKAWADLLSNQPKRVNCNKIGTQTFCSSN